MSTAVSDARARAHTVKAVSAVGLVVGLGIMVGASAARADAPPYSLPVTLPAAPAKPPPVAPRPPYTPVVLNLIAQLEPTSTAANPVRAEITNASRILHGGTNAVTPGAFQNPTCHNVGPVSAPTGTNPSIMAICWTDAQGVLNTSGPLQAVGTTGPMTLMGLGSSFDLDLANVWGQTEGTESREYMVTGLFGPQTDIDRQPNWGRNLSTTGEDPFLSRRMVASQIHGIQGVGTMSQMKHFAVYNGQNQNANTDVQDQALHEEYLPPYEGGFVDADAAATMCSYQLLRDTSTHLPANTSSLTQASPFGTLAPPTWNLNESHFACEQPLLENYVLRNLWHSQALIGSDYPATHSTSAILQGEDQEMPTQQGFFSDTTTLTAGQQTDPTGSTCADASGNATSCSASGALHVGGMPGPGCPTYGCPLVDAVVNHEVPLAVFNQSLARLLYQEERFGMLGCEQTPRLAMCTNPGGLPNGDRTGATQIAAGPTSGTPQLGTKNGDAAVVERYSEEGAVLLKNQGATLPLKSSDLSGGILVTGPGANHTIADPTNEASLGFPDRNAINPLQQLKDLSGNASAFTYVPANDPTGSAVPATALSQTGANPVPTAATGGLNRTAGPGSPGVDRTLDFTSVSGSQLAPGSYTWSGYVYVPMSDTYTLDFQSSAALTPAAVTVSFDGTSRTLTKAGSAWSGAACGTFAAPSVSAPCSVPGSPTTAGFTEGGLINQQFVAGGMAAGSYHAITITFDNSGAGAASLRFAYNRLQGDIDDAATAARGKRMAIVFL